LRVMVGPLFYKPFNPKFRIWAFLFSPNFIQDSVKFYKKIALMSLTPSKQQR